MIINFIGGFTPNKKVINLSLWKRAVIKVGSALVAARGRGCSTQFLLPIAGFIMESINRGKEIILVSSGAVAAGLSTQPQKQQKESRSIPEKQAFAAIGQPLLMATWSRLYDFPCAQLLLTYDDFFNRKRYVNAKNTLVELLKLGTLPIVNENDTVAVDELKVGDNDNLAAHVAVMAEADLLIICTDIDGLYNANPRIDQDAQLITEVKKIDQSIYRLAKGKNSPLATGGMFTKIQAAEKAVARGIDTIIVNGTDQENFQLLLKQKLFGTLFHKIEKPITGKKYWMLHVLPTAGTVFVDSGAKNAICLKGASLLPSGIIKVEGDFSHGDAVLIVFQDGSSIQKIAKGICQYDMSDLDKIKGKHSSEIEKILGIFATDVVIHRDDLVLMED